MSNLIDAIAIARGEKPASAQDLASATLTLALFAKTTLEQKPVWMQHENGTLWAPTLSYPQMRPEKFRPLYAEHAPLTKEHFYSDMWYIVRNELDAADKGEPDDMRQVAADAMKPMIRFMSRVSAGKARSSHSVVEFSELLARYKALATDAELLELDLAIVEAEQHADK